MRTIVLAIALIGCAANLAAQEQEPLAFEVRPFIGASIPTGEQRNYVRDAPLIGAQAAVQVRRSFHLVGTFAWIPADSRYEVANSNVSVLRYDVGAEVSLAEPIGAWELEPFVGFGGGGRSYLYRDMSLEDESCYAGYGALGTQMRVGGTVARAQLRDDVYCFNSPIPGVKSETRNELDLSLGLTFHFR